MASITESGRKYSSGDKRSWTRFAVLTSGLACLALGTFLIGDLISHDPGDPSWNQSINRSAMNLMGLPGARVSDLLLQWIGFAAWLLPLVLIDWAVGVIGKLGRDGFAHINIAPPLAAMAAAIVVALMLLYLMGLPALAFTPRAGEGKKHYVRPQNRRDFETEDEADALDEEAAAKPGLIARVRGLLPIPHLPWKRGGDNDAPLSRDRREPSLAGIAGDDDDGPLEDIKLPPVRRSAVPVDMPKKAKKREAQRQALLDLGPSGEHLLPELELLNEVPPARYA